MSFIKCWIWRLFLWIGRREQLFRPMVAICRLFRISNKPKDKTAHKARSIAMSPMPSLQHSSTKSTWRGTSSSSKKRPFPKEKTRASGRMMKTIRRMSIRMRLRRWFRKRVYKPRFKEFVHHLRWNGSASTKKKPAPTKRPSTTSV